MKGDKAGNEPSLTSRGNDALRLLTYAALNATVGGMLFAVVDTTIGEDPDSALSKMLIATGILVLPLLALGSNPRARLPDSVFVGGVTVLATLVFAVTAGGALGFGGRVSGEAISGVILLFGLATAAIVYAALVAKVRIGLMLAVMMVLWAGMGTAELVA